MLWRPVPSAKILTSTKAVTIHWRIWSQGTMLSDSLLLHEDKIQKGADVAAHGPMPKESKSENMITSKGSISLRLGIIIQHTTKGRPQEYSNKWLGKRKFFLGISRKFDLESLVSEFLDELMKLHVEDRRLLLSPLADCLISSRLWRMKELLSQTPSVNSPFREPERQDGLYLTFNNLQTH